MEDQSTESSEEEIVEENTNNKGEGQVKSSTDNPTDGDASLIPKLGMVFDAEEEAFQFYMAYGWRTGFGITRRSNNTYEGLRYRSTFICSKGGTSRLKTGYKRAPRKRGIKTGCNAKMIVKDHHFQNRWEIIVLDLEHNHPLEPNSLKFRKYLKDSPFCEKMSLLTYDNMDSASNSIPGGSGEYVNRRKKMDNNRKLGLAEGDLEALMGYCDKMQDQNPYFFYCLDMNEGGQLRNIFWADARSRAAYNYFFDVIKFDMTKFSDQYDILFASFIGVNHHGHEVLLGCGLVAAGNIETYIWLLKTWLRCMNDRQPHAIITGYCNGIDIAVKKVFPDIRHRFCLWDILKKLPEKLEGTAEAESISFKFNRAVYDSLSITDFEREWQEMAVQFHLETNEWLSNLYEVRNQWVPIFVKDTFWAGMSITDRNDAVNNFFDGWMRSDGSVKAFINHFDNVMKSKLEKEAYEDLRSCQLMPQLITRLPYEEQIAKIFTIDMFQKFQYEIKQLFQVSSNIVDRSGSVVSYIVTEFVNGKKMDYRVVYDNVEEDIWCSCRSYQYRGLVCRHALSILRQEFIMLIPPKCTTSRWRKDFKRIVLSNLTPFVAPFEELSGYEDLYRRGHQYFAEIVEFGAANRDSKEYALSVMKEVRDKVISYEKTLRDQRIDSDVTLTSYAYNPVNEDFTDDVAPITLSTKGWDPMQAHSKSRARKKKIANPNVLNVLKKRKAKNSNTTADTSPIGLNARNNANEVTNVQYNQLNEGWSLTPGGPPEAFPFGVETISFDLSQYNTAPTPNFHWPESSRSRLL